jgi:ABC-type methionine transport system ATPase subunit
MTVIMVNHQLDLVTDWCSDLVQLHRGNVVRSQSAQAVNWQEVRQSMQIASKNAENDDEWE